MDIGDEEEDNCVQFEKCRAGLSLYRKDSVRSTLTEVREEPRSHPLSPTSKTKEMFALTETISSMARLRMDDQRCSLKKVVTEYCRQLSDDFPLFRNYREKQKYLLIEKVTLSCWI